MNDQSGNLPASQRDPPSGLADGQSEEAHRTGRPSDGQQRAEVHGSGAVAQGPEARALHVGGDVQAPIHMGRGNITQRITQYITNPPAIKVIYQDLGQLLHRHRWLLLLVLILEIPLAVVFLQVKDRFLISWLAYLALATILAGIAWGWYYLGRQQLIHWPAGRSLVIVAVATLLWLSLLGLQVQAALLPGQFAEDQWGIAVATFGEGADFRVTRRSRQISQLLLRDLEANIEGTPELAENVGLRRLGVIRDSAQGRVDGERVGARLVLWGQILERDEGILVYIQALQAPGMSDNPNFPQSIPIVQAASSESIALEDINSLAVKDVARSQSLAITAYSIGLYYYQDPEYRKAAEQFQVALRHLTETTDGTNSANLGLVFYYLGKSYQLLGQYEESMAMLEQAVAYNPQDPAIALAQAYNHRALGQPDAMQEALERVIDLCASLPEHKVACAYDRALAYEAMDDQASALREYRLITRQYKPDLFIAHISEARALRALADQDGGEKDLRRLQEAQQVLEAARPLAADSPQKQVWLDLELGGLYVDMGRLDEAIALYRQALEQDPSLTLPYLYLAEALESKGQLAEAGQLLEQLTAVSDDPGWSHGVLAEFYLRTEDLPGAIDNFEIALQYKLRDKAVTYTKLALAYAGVDEQLYPDRERRALAAFEAALQDPDPAEHYVRSEYGRILYQFGHTKEAIAQFEEAARLDPTVAAETRLNLGQLYEIVGEPEKARVVYEELVSRAADFSEDKLWLLDIAQERLDKLPETPAGEPNP